MLPTQPARLGRLLHNAEKKRGEGWQAPSPHDTPHPGCVPPPGGEESMGLSRRRMVVTPAGAGSMRGGPCADRGRSALTQVNLSADWPCGIERDGLGRVMHAVYRLSSPDKASSAAPN